jgi:hypothetical protein
MQMTMIATGIGGNIVCGDESDTMIIIMVRDGEPCGYNDDNDND